MGRLTAPHLIGGTSITCAYSTIRHLVANTHVAVKTSGAPHGERYDLVTAIRSIHTVVSVCVICMAASVFLPAAAEAQGISGVRWYRVADDRIVVWYDLDTRVPADTAMEVAPAGGPPFRPRIVEGDIGRRIVPGHGKRAVWRIAPGDPDISAGFTVKVVLGAGALPAPSPSSTARTATPRGAAESPDSLIAFPAPDQGRLLTACPAQARITMDGVLDEPCWLLAESATGFFQSEPNEGAPATEPTEVRILYDSENLYIGFLCFDSAPDRIIHNELRLDGAIKDDDNVAVVIDTFDDRRGGFYFSVNPNGARLDGKITKSGGNSESRRRRRSSTSSATPGGARSMLVNDNWNGVWEVAARITPEGWTAEIVIPFKTLRFPGGENMDWGINFQREIKRKKEDTLWCSWGRDDGLYQLSKVGRLCDIRDVGRGGLTEVKPFTLGSMGKETGIDLDSDVKYGVDLKYPLTSDFTLDLTTLTDFAQVESDRTRINLTRDNLYYPEKREFFLEGSEIFEFGTPFTTPTYTRRIGFSVDGEPIPILGGAKITGKSNGWSLGFMNMVTDEKNNIPATNYTLLRVKKDVLSRSQMGFYVTGIRDAERHKNVSWGADFVYITGRFLGNRNLTMEGYAADNYTPGLTKDTGSYRFNISYPNDLLNITTSHQVIGENYLPEIGFIRRSAVNQTFVSVAVSPRPGIPGIRKLLFNPVDMFYIADRSNRLESRMFNVTVFGLETVTDETLRIVYATSYEYLDEDFDLFEDAVVPPGIYRWHGWEADIETSRSRPLSAQMHAETGGFYTGDITTISVAVTGKVGSHLAVTPDISVNSFTLGERSYEAKEYSLRMETNISTRVNAGTLLQWNNEEEIANINFRLHIIPQIGSDIYLVYNHLWDTERDFKTDFNAAIAKVAWLFMF